MDANAFLSGDTWGGLIARSALITAVTTAVSGLVGAAFGLSAGYVLAIAAVVFVGSTASLVAGGRAIRRRDIHAALSDAANGLASNVPYIEQGKRPAPGYTGELWPTEHLKLKRETGIRPALALIESASQGVKEYNDDLISGDVALARIAAAREAIRDELGSKGYGAGAIESLPQTGQHREIGVKTDALKPTDSEGG